MTEEPDERPVWARPEAFPPAGPGWGWVDRKGRRHACGSFEELAAAIVDDAGARMDLVWTPASEFQVLPEEIPSLHESLKQARIRWALWEIGEGRRQMLVFGVMLGLLSLFALATKQNLLAFSPAGLALLLFLVLGLIPWYQGRKRLERAQEWSTTGVLGALPELRFETWLMRQKAPLTRLLLILIAVVGLFQIFGPLPLFRPQGGDQLQAAALLKLNGHPQNGWRLATAPFLHGHPIHFLFNAMALAYLGRRMEVLARWPHVAMVFVLAAWIGGEASARFVSKPSLGASGALLGMLGFLLVFESLHRRLVPEDSRRRLLGGLVATAVIGAIGFRFIDNAAHAGGLLAGMAYALALFPKSASIHRPRETNPDRVVGLLALAAIVVAAGFTCFRLMG